MLVYVLIFAADIGNNIYDDFDVFGLYSTEELAKQAAEWRRTQKGLYVGCDGKSLYNRYLITTRIMDYNLPKEATV